ncbi:MAG: hypothetical protein ACT4P6_02930 [Gemmatimonadaceae bacterium]
MDDANRKNGLFCSAPAFFIPVTNAERREGSVIVPFHAAVEYIVRGRVPNASIASCAGVLGVTAQGSPIGRPFDVCIVVRARATIGSQLKEQIVSGSTIPFVAPDQAPDTVNVNIVLPP